MLKRKPLRGPVDAKTQSIPEPNVAAHVESSHAIGARTLQYPSWMLAVLPRNLKTYPATPWMLSLGLLPFTVNLILTRYTWKRVGRVQDSIVKCLVNP